MMVQRKKNEDVVKSFDSILRLYFTICEDFLANKIVPHVGQLHALSVAVHGHSSVDINLKLYEVLGRMSMAGIWSFWLANKLNLQNPVEAKNLRAEGFNYQENIKKLFENNPILFNPYKDDQIIEITLALFLLSINGQNNHNISSILNFITNSIFEQFAINDRYPGNFQTYYDILEHPADKSNEYRESVTQGSVLYPFLSIFAAIFNDIESYELIKNLKDKYLKDCNFQIFFLDESSEVFLYNYKDTHGATLSHINVNQEPNALLDEIDEECKQSNQVLKLSALKFDLWPIVLMACRHHRLPIPVHLVMELRKQTVN